MTANLKYNNNNSYQHFKYVVHNLKEQFSVKTIFGVIKTKIELN